MLLLQRKSEKLGQVVVDLDLLLNVLEVVLLFAHFEELLKVV